MSKDIKKTIAFNSKWMPYWEEKKMVDTRHFQNKGIFGFPGPENIDKGTKITFISALLAEI